MQHGQEFSLRSTDAKLLGMSNSLSRGINHTSQLSAARDLLMQTAGRQAATALGGCHLVPKQFSRRHSQLPCYTHNEDELHKEANKPHDDEANGCPDCHLHSAQAVSARDIGNSRCTVHTQSRLPLHAIAWLSWQSCLHAAARPTLMLTVLQYLLEAQRP